MNQQSNTISLPIPVLDIRERGHYGSHMEALYHMVQQGVRHLGWLNEGIELPAHCAFELIYKNWSGSSCLFVDPMYMVAYSVDMGD